MRGQNGLEHDEPFQFSDPRQSKIYLNLQLFGAGPAAMFRDACATMSGRFDLFAASNIVGHLLREVMSALRKVLLGRDEEVTIKGRNSDARKARRILERLAFRETDFVWAFWLNEIIQGETNLHRTAHRSGLALPRPIDEAFRTFWEDFLLFLDELLDVARDHILDIARPFEKMAQSDHPSNADADTVYERLPHHPVYLGRFVQKIKSPKWVELLDERRYFDSPPTAIDAGGQIYADAWPQGELLVGIATDIPKTVVDILNRIDWPWNPYLVEDFIKIAVSIPITEAKPILDKLDKWIRTHGLVRIAHDVSELVEHLGKNDAIDYALPLAERLLEFEPSAEPLSISGPKTVIEHYLFTATVTHRLAPLAHTFPLKVLKMLCTKLSEGIAIVALGFKNSDFVSRMYRCDLADGAMTDASFDVLECLAFAIRDYGITAVHENQILSSELCTLLDGFEQQVFTRLNVIVVARNASKAPNIVQQLLTSRDLFDASWLADEFNSLAAEGFLHVTDKQRAAYMTMIARVPEYLRKLRDPEKSQRLDRWQYTRLRPIAAFLGKLGQSLRKLAGDS